MKLFKIVFMWALLPLAVVLAGAGSGYLAWAWLMTRAPVEPAHAALTVERLSEVSQLLTLKLDVSDVLLSRIEGYSGGVQAAVLIKGDVSLGIDLAQARFEDVDQSHHTAILILQPPTPSEPRLNHERTRIVSLEVTGLWRGVPGSRAEQAIANQALNEAQHLLASAVREKNADQRARRHAEAVLTAFCRSLSWEITIHWADMPSS